MNDHDTYREFQTALDKLMAVYGTQTRLCKALCITRMALHRWTTGTATPPIMTQRKVIFIAGKTKSVTNRNQM